MRLTLCLIAALLLTPGCTRSGKSVVFVLPAGLRGEFRIVKDSMLGVELTEDEGEWVVAIPPDGELRVKDDRPFSRWHSEHALRVGGGMVWIEPAGTRAGCDPMTGDHSTEYDGTTHKWRIR